MSFQSYKTSPSFYSKVNTNKQCISVTRTHRRLQLYSILSSVIIYIQGWLLIPNAPMCTYPDIPSSELERDSTSWVNDGRSSGSPDQHWCMNEYLNKYCKGKHFVACGILKLLLFVYAIIDNPGKAWRYCKKVIESEGKGKNLRDLNAGPDHWDWEAKWQRLN